MQDIILNLFPPAVVLPECRAVYDRTLALCQRWVAPLPLHAVTPTLPPGDWPPKTGLGWAFGGSTGGFSGAFSDAKGSGDFTVSGIGISGSAGPGSTTSFLEVLAGGMFKPASLNTELILDLDTSILNLCNIR